MTFFRMNFIATDTALKKKLQINTKILGNLNAHSSLLFILLLFANFKNLLISLTELV